MRHSEEIGEICKALAKAQGRFGTVLKDKEGLIPLKSGGSYRYRYAELSAVLDAIRAPLSEEGLAYMQFLGSDKEGPFAVSFLGHLSGQFFESDPLRIQADRPGAQGMGAVFTYARRYQIQAMLGLASSDEDDDAQTATADQRSAATLSTGTQIPALLQPPAEPKASGPAAPKPASPGYINHLRKLVREGELNELLQEFHLESLEGINTDQGFLIQKYLDKRNGQPDVP